jgi:hypothetical protein
MTSIMSSKLILVLGFVLALESSHAQCEEKEVKAGHGRLVHAHLLSLGTDGEIIPNKSSAVITPAQLIVSQNLTYTDQLRAHASILDKVAQVEKQAGTNLLAALSAKNYDDVARAGEDLENNRKAVVPYALAQARAQALMADGYRLNDLSGKICKSNCATVEPIAALFFFTPDRKGLAADLKAEPKKNPKKDSNDEICSPGKNCSICINGFNICDFIDFVSDKPLDQITFGLLPQIREGILRGDNGEIANFIRDPGRKLVDVIQKARDLIVPADDNGEIAKILRDPIKCTIGRLWGDC